MLSSVARYVHALGGELKVSAVFGDTTYTPALPFAGTRAEPTKQK